MERRDTGSRNTSFLKLSRLLAEPDMVYFDDVQPSLEVKKPFSILMYSSS